MVVADVEEVEDSSYPKVLYDDEVKVYLKNSIAFEMFVKFAPVVSLVTLLVWGTFADVETSEVLLVTSVERAVEMVPYIVGYY